MLTKRNKQCLGVLSSLLAISSFPIVSSCRSIHYKAVDLGILSQHPDYHNGEHIKVTPNEIKFGGSLIDTKADSSGFGEPIISTNNWDIYSITKNEHVIIAVFDNRPKADKITSSELSLKGVWGESNRWFSPGARGLPKFVFKIESWE